MFSFCWHVIFLTFALELHIQISKASGTFELQILSIQNYRGELADGSCCGGYRSIDGSCPLQCNTAFQLCLKEYQSDVKTTGTCTFGNQSTDVVAGNSFSVQSEPTKEVVLRLPFSFRWTRSFTFILDALDVVNKDIPYTARIIERKVYSGIILPSTEWHTLLYTGTAAKINFRIRVICGPYYYNSTCTVFCKPRNDKFGHYMCSDKGEKICLPGWTGNTCEEAICKEGCHPEHGYCEQPGQCLCRHGWKSELCDQCVPYPGCKHGYCNGSPWQCICDVNWGGIMCDQDLNYCGNHHPCQNSGTCENVAPDQYRCVCSQGFSGNNCEIVDNPCMINPCLNGGTCSELNSTSSCECTPGWTGAHCEININECESSPCSNGGTCVDLVNGYHCICIPGWEGSTCEKDADECEWKPCVNAVGCHNHDGDYECQCQDGWEGKNCTLNINDCIGHCQNGATCIDLVNDYHCACLPGFTGRDCQTNINECASNPCTNGGECVDLIFGYRCICPVGFKGSECEIDVDLCNPNPCKNDASCFNMNRDYYCHCPEGFFGKNCSHQLSDCILPYCEDMDSCIAYIGSNTSNAEIVKTNVCGEHGKCISEPFSDFNCVCDLGYTGRYCHENINDCASYPCRNGGTCIDGMNSYICLCREGWEGPQCNVEKNECESNPCLNNGTCIDAEAGFWCDCKQGWKGKTCNLKHSHCDVTTCQNGGTCRDMGDTFHCTCNEEWVGHSCHIPINPSCQSNPCQNGGTCINKENTYLCMCREGFGGQQCQHNIDDCQPNPCFNGGHCIDGINWFMCECTPGFTGPDCRININECASSPCSAGSTCVDGINDFKCICPPQKTGRVCETDIKKTCEFQGIIRMDGSQWEFECNTCLCQDGKVICSRVSCEKQLCEPRGNFGDYNKQCFEGQLCVPLYSTPCFSKPCAVTGRCLSEPNANLYIADHLPKHCKPNNAIISDNCAKLSVKFSENILPMFINNNRICLVIQKYIWSLDFVNIPVFAQCAIQENTVQLMEITISTDIKETKETQLVLMKVVQDLSDYMRKNKFNSNFHESAIEVMTETYAIASESIAVNQQKYLVPFVTSLSIALVVGIAALIIIFKQRCHQMKISCSFSHSDENNKQEHPSSVNNQNADNWKRYLNKLHAPSDTATLSDCITKVDSSFYQVSDKMYKTLPPEANKNRSIPLPFKNNLHKCDSVMQGKECYPENELIV
ncbi:protein serrate [Caerostris darwini]|uniref:Delta-like protein n=1 Tax=Caerostris darwini TaxID=1538125 RepID=A0AAV4PW08_9ARAC|nr:protein serrate [Caerostris darwini]